MDLTTLASGLLWVISLLLPGNAGYASRLGLDVPPLRTPDSARFQLEGNVQAGFNQTSVRGQGAFAQPDRFQLSLEAMGERLEQVVIGETMYIRTPEKTEWEVVDLREAVDQAGPLGAFPFAPGYEQEALDALGAFTSVGDELVAGISTRHYRGELDLLKLFGDLFGSARELGVQISSFKIGLDFWIGVSDGYLRQIKLRLDLDPTGLGTLGGALQADLTVSFYDFDRPVSIVAPFGPTPPAQIPTAAGSAPLRAPAQLPRTGQMPMELALPLGGVAMLGLGLGLRRRVAARPR
jgi:hypothetical protein